jgi:uncharacterized Zn-binding protein involved in type VI secretion
MGPPAAKLGDRVLAVDMHLVATPAGVPLLLPHPFNGMFDGNLSANVRLMGRPAATVGSTATSIPPHVPSGLAFTKPPTHRGTVLMGSLTVRINGRPAARAGDTAMTCNDPVDLPVGHVQATGTVNIG